MEVLLGWGIREAYRRRWLMVLDLEGQVRLGWAGVEFSDCIHI